MTDNIAPYAYSSETPIIEEISITTHLGDKIDLRPQLVRLVLDEDILSPFLSGSVLIKDNVGFFEKFSFSGGEKFTVKFYSWTYSENNDLCDYIHRTFTVLKFTDIKHINDYTKTYVIHFASPEFLKNETIRISKAFKEKYISKIVEEIMTGDWSAETPRGLDFPTEELQQKIVRSTCADPVALTQAEYQKVDNEDSIELFIEKTAEIEEVTTFPYTKPFDIINILAGRSFRYVAGNTDNRSSANFLFFENKRGFQFTALETLIENRPKSQSRLVYSLGATNIPGQTRQVNIDIIQKLVVNNAYDIISAIRNGVFASKLISYDMLTGQKYITEFDYVDSFYQSQTLEKPIDDSGYWPQVYLDDNNKNPWTQKPDSKRMFLPLNPTKGLDKITGTQTLRNNEIKELTGHQEYLQKRISQLMRYNLWSITAIIAANSKHKVGDIVELDMSEVQYNPDETTGQDPISSKQAKYYSGNYLVTKIKHVLLPTSYTMEMELSKDSYKEKIGRL